LLRPGYAERLREYRRRILPVSLVQNSESLFPTVRLARLLAVESGLMIL